MYISLADVAFATIEYYVKLGLKNTWPMEWPMRPPDLNPIKNL